MDTRLEKDANSEEKRKEGTFAAFSINLGVSRPRRNPGTSTRLFRDNWRYPRNRRRRGWFSSLQRRGNSIWNSEVSKFLVKLARVYISSRSRIRISNSNLVELFLTRWLSRISLPAKIVRNFQVEWKNSGSLYRSTWRAVRRFPD